MGAIRLALADLAGAFFFAWHFAASANNNETEVARNDFLDKETQTAG